MTFFSPWAKCQRCDRAGFRWGIFAPSTKNARVLVLTASASRASQAVGAPDPLPASVAAAIVETYGLKRRDVHVDVLLACGASENAHAHEAAACAQRLEDQAQVNGWPVALVVIVGDHTARLARYAGLLTASGFRLGGQVRPFVLVHDVAEVGQGSGWAALGTSRSRPSPPMLYPSAATVLVELVGGRSAGHAWRPLGGQWRRSYERPTVELVERHVRGRGWLSPYRPIGPWPYCVLDVDLHNAIQWQQYEQTVKKLNALFKRSLFFKSSPSGGLHVYVRLPPNTTYADAAVWLTEFMQMHELLFYVTPSSADATARGPVATRLVEVPLHPPRLPFGLGSALRGFVNPTKAVDRFTAWLVSTDFSDFESAKHAVEQNRKKKPRWAERAAWSRTYVHELELEALGAKKSKKKLALNDPWRPYLSRLAPSLSLLVTNGCLAFGTRTSTMTRIADALAQMVEPDEARALLRHWVEHRDHQSEDIHLDAAEVLAFGDRLIDDAFEERGVPARTWALADAAVKKMYADIAAGRERPLVLAEEDCRHAALHVLRLFYNAKRRHIPIASEQFGLAITKEDIGGLPVRRPNQNMVEDVRAALVRLLLLVPAGAASYTKQKAAEYRLAAPYWPFPPTGEPLVYQVT